MFSIGGRRHCPSAAHLKITRLMKRIGYLFCAFAVVVVFVGYYKFDSDVPKARDPDAVNVELQADAQAQISVPVQMGATSKTWGSSPFDAHGGIALIDRVKLISDRKARMKKLGYETPEIYYSMSLKKLRALAKTGDMFALAQLGEQYFSESDVLELDPDYDFSVSPRGEAKKYLTLAINAGHVRVAAVLAKQYAAEGQMVEAYAWNILAEKVGDFSGRAWGKEAYNNLTVHERRVANLRSEEMLAIALKRFSVSASSSQP